MSALDRLARGEIRPFEPGISFDIPRGTYDAVPAMNQSLLKRYIQTVYIEGGCPKKFKYWFDHRGEETKGDALVIGSALDCLLLEPDEYEKKFVVLPDDAPKRPAGRQVNAKKPSPETTAAVAWWESFDGALEGRDILTPDQESGIRAMHLAVTSDPKTQDIFKYCRKAVIQAEILGIPSKGEIDLFSDKTEYIFDLKTARTASLKPFAKAAWELGYHFQAAFYLKLAQALGLDKTMFCFVVVENEPPHCVACYTLDLQSDSVQYAWKLISEMAPDLFMRFERNQWPDFEDFAPLRFAGWANREAVDFLEG